MKKDFYLKAFTLIELMVVISIIMIIAIWASNLNLNNLSSIQKLEIFSNSIKTDFESIRNNAMLWKWIWTDFNTPENWSMSFTAPETIEINSDSNLYKKIRFPEDFTIKQIDCFKLDGITSTNFFNTNSESWIIEFEWSNLRLIWDCNDNSKILKVTLTNKVSTKELWINTLNWLAEIK